MSVWPEQNLFIFLMNSMHKLMVKWESYHNHNDTTQRQHNNSNDEPHQLNFNTTTTTTCTLCVYMCFFFIIL